MIPRSVKTFAPATISNLGPGFDVLGVAVHAPGDFVVASRQTEHGLSFSVKTDQTHVPQDPERNVAAYVAQLMLHELKPSFGIEMMLQKSMPIGSGLGSSAASSVAAAMAVNELLPKPLKKSDLLRFALEGELFTCGSLHADNAAPSLFGGGCLIRSYDPLDVVPITIDPSLVWIVVHPHIVVLTKKARAILPRSIPLRSAVRQWGNVAGLVLGLARGDRDLIRRSVEDVIMEPARARLIPGFDDVKRAALKAGALGCSISGSGPSVFSIAPSMRAARIISTAMTTSFRRAAGVSSDIFISRTNLCGASVVWRKDA
ncbi:homoserine kinase [bacterium]|nr:MAG: homoserine kinase [bacterium]